MESIVDAKNANLTPSEMGRIGKLENSVVAAAAWAQIRRPLNREELDKRQLGDTSSKKEVCPWSTLHEIFSDADPNSPFSLECTNDAVCHCSGGVLVFLLIQAEDGPLGSYSHIFGRIKDIDPRIILPGQTPSCRLSNSSLFNGRLIWAQAAAATTLFSSFPILPISEGVRFAFFHQLCSPSHRPLPEAGQYPGRSSIACARN